MKKVTALYNLLPNLHRPVVQEIDLTILYRIKCICCHSVLVLMLLCNTP